MKHGTFLQQFCAAWALEWFLNIYFNHQTSSAQIVKGLTSVQIHGQFLYYYSMKNILLVLEVK